MYIDKEKLDDTFTYLNDKSDEFQINYCKLITPVIIDVTTDKGVYSYDVLTRCIIDGDKFQKEYKNQYRKELITDLVQGILFLVIAGAGLFFGDKLLLKLFIYIFPLFILTYAVNLFSLGIGAFKKHKSQAIAFFIQSVIYTLFAVYIFLNPISSLGYVLVVIGAIILANAIIKMIYLLNLKGK